MQEFSKEYTTLDARLRGLDPIDDRGTIKQLIAAKSEILKAWKAAVGNTYAFKAALQECQLAIEQGDLPHEVIEAKKVDIALLRRAAKGEKIMPETRDEVLAEIRKGGK